MLPVSVIIATTAILGGIGGAAMFIPIFLILFPFLGPEYVIAGPIAAIGVALITETFGFSSGLIGYLRKRLIDFQVAKSLIIIAVPAAIIGSLAGQIADPNLLKILYGGLMLILTFIILRRPSTDEKQEITRKTLAGEYAHIGHERKVVDKSGNVYNYHLCHLGKGRSFTGVGGFITGMMSVGIGEILMPQLVRSCKVPVPVAAATSVLVVIITVMSASVSHVLTLVSEGGFEVIPWNLIIYTAPGVVIGGQIGSRLQGIVPSNKMERIFGILFGIIGIAMISIVFVPQFG
jgi:uncharacterized membrane protein YfcA